MTATAIDQSGGKKKRKHRKTLGKGKLTLGKMNDDVKFLQKIMDIKTDQPMKTKFSVRFNLFDRLTSPEFGSKYYKRETHHFKKTIEETAL